MNKRNEKNFAIPRINGDNTSERKWALLTKKGDQWHWIALDKTMQVHTVTAANYFEAVKALKMEIADKSINIRGMGAMARTKNVAKIYGAAFYFANISRDKMEIADFFNVQKRTVTRWAKEPEWEQALRVWRYEGERNFLIPPRRDIAHNNKELFKKARDIYLKALLNGEPTHKLATITGKAIGLPRATIHRWAKQHGWRETIIKHS